MWRNVITWRIVVLCLTFPAFNILSLDLLCERSCEYINASFIINGLRIMRVNSSPFDHT